MLEITNITKIYNKNRKNAFKALDGVTIAFPEKGMVFLVGKSGCGKTTLLNIIGMLDDFDSGILNVDGQTNFSMQEADAYRNGYIGILFQSLNLLSDFSVGENLSLAKEINQSKMSQTQIESVLNKVDLSGYSNRRINQLSGGEKQRVAIARTLVKSPRIIIADEPTGSLDEKNGEAVFKILKDLSREKLVIVVTHDKDAAREYGDRIIHMSNGKIVRDELNQPVLQEQENYLKNTNVNASLLETGETTIESFYETEENLQASHNSNIGDADINKQNISSCAKAKPSKTKLPLKTLLKLSFQKIRRQKLRFCISLLLVVLSFSVLSITMVFASYNIGKVCADSFEQSGEKGAVIAKGEPIASYGYVSRRGGVLMFDNDYDKIINMPMIDFLDKFYLMPWSQTMWTEGDDTKPYAYPELNGYFETCANNIEYFGIGYSIMHGNFPTHSGRDERGYLYAAITDYTAYLIEMYGIEDEHGNLLSNLTANELIDKALVFNSETVVITGIIKTDFDIFKPYIFIDYSELNSQIKNDLWARIYDSCLYSSFYFAYGTHENFYVTTKHDGQYQLYSKDYFDNIIKQQAEDNPFRPVKITWAKSKGGNAELSNGEILLTDSEFFNYFGKRFNADNEYTYSYKRALKMYPENDTLIDGGKYTVVGVFIDLDSEYLGRDYAVVFSDEDFDNVANSVDNVTAFYTKLPSNYIDCVDFFNALDKDHFFPFNQNQYAIFEVYNKLSIYKYVFSYVSIIISIACIFLIADFMLSSIKDRTGEMGILRAMGVRGGDISLMLILQALLMLFLSTLICVGMVFGLIAILNNILYNSFINGIAAVLLDPIPLLTPSLSLFIQTFTIMTGILALSTLLPMLQIIYTKPVKCIQKG